MMTKWRVGDLIDFEYLLQRDDAIEADSRIGVRDLVNREIYLQHIRPELQKTESTGQAKRRLILRLWLERRREMERIASGEDGVLPGELFDHVRRLMLWLFCAIGGIGGIGVGFSLLSYGGKQPINVAVYLTVVVLTQLILLLAACGYLLVGRNRDVAGRNFSLYFLLSGLLARFMKKAARQSLEKLPAGHRDTLLASLGLVRGKSRSYGPLFRWPVFVIAQLFGITFNLGVLCATLVRVLLSDLAFGWQSTIQLSSKVVYWGTATISFPWSWILPAGIAHPSLEQIRGSRLVLKEGAYHLATADLVSWWPFLCLTVLFYGLLPRVVLCFAGGRILERTLSGLTFTGMAEAKLLSRLRTPIVNTAGGEGIGSMAPMGYPDDLSGRKGLFPEGDVPPGQTRSISHSRSQPGGGTIESVRDRPPGDLRIPLADQQVISVDSGPSVETADASETLDDENRVTSLPDAVGNESSDMQRLDNQLFASCDLQHDAEGVGEKRPEGHTAGFINGFEEETDQAGRIIALVSDEIIDDCPEGELASIISRRFGFKLGCMLPVTFDFSEDKKKLSQEMAAMMDDDPLPLFVLQEAWQPPIRETLMFFRDLRECLGSEWPICVGLIGKPEPETIFTKVDLVNWKTWSRQIAGMGDPGIMIERLGADEKE